MASPIKCPNCGNEFAIEDSFSEEYKQKLEADKIELRAQMANFKKEKEEELLKKTKEFQQREKELQLSIEQNLRRSISADFENEVKMLKQNNRDAEEKLKNARQKELEFLQKEQELKNKEEELEISVQRRLQEERTKLSEEIRQIEEQKVANKETEYQLRMRELEKQIEDQKKLVEEMRRKVEQGSMQLQGEAQELLLEEILQEQFPYDLIEEVSKGSEGADCVQTIRNGLGKDCGRIIYESKRAKNWANNWVEKLRNDMRTKKADVAILVTQAYPRDMDRFGIKDGIWICSFKEVIGLSSALREGLIKVYEAQKNQENRGDKMQLLYDFLTSTEFRQHIEAIVEGFVSLRNSITKEKIQMEKIWKERERQLDMVLRSTSGMYGSIKGIAGTSIGDIPLLEGPGDDDMAH